MALILLWYIAMCIEVEGAITLAVCGHLFESLSLDSILVEFFVLRNGLHNQAANKGKINGESLRCTGNEMQGI